MQHDLFSNDASPDNDERVQDFLSRHGGAADETFAQHSDAGGLSGWTEIVAADGYRLRSDWSRSGGRSEMRFSEIPPDGGSNGGVT